MNPASLLRLALVLATIPGLGQAQSTRFLQSDRWELAIGERLEIDFQARREGTLEAVPWPARFDWFFVRAGGGQTNLDDPRVAEGRRTLELTAERAGITLIAADRPAYVEPIAKGDLRVFLAENVGRSTLKKLDLAALNAFDGEALRVRRIESTKALLRVLGKEGFLPNSAVAQSKTGQAVEIRPLADPTSVPVKSDLPLRVYVPNPGKQGTKVIARHLGTGRTQTFFTDRMGAGFFTINMAGLWMVEAHHARPAKDENADWEIHTATLTFEVPPGDPRQGGGK